MFYDPNPKEEDYIWLMSTDPLPAKEGSLHGLILLLDDIGIPKTILGKTGSIRRRDQPKDPMTIKGQKKCFPFP
jgi:hypothetical protein